MRLGQCEKTLTAEAIRRPTVRDSTERSVELCILEAIREPTTGESGEKEDVDI